MADIGNIRKRIDANSQSLKEGGAAALGTLILGGSKAEAALNGVGQAIATHLLGPMGKFVGVAYGATKGIYALTKAFASMGTGSAAKIETAQNQLRVLLKGLDAAKQRLRELRSFGVESPFNLQDILQGNRALESLTRGALSNAAAMRMIGDAASQAGVGFQDMAVYVGRLYDGLAAGRPVGEVLFRLAELGVISGQARTALERLQESGAGFSEVWRVVESELARSSGTMSYTSKSFEGLQETANDTADALKVAFSENFLEGQKESLQAQIKAMENLQPVVASLGDSLGGLVSVVNSLGSRFLAFVTGLPLVAQGLEFVTRAVGTLSVALVALAGSAVGGKAVVWLTGLAGASTLTGRALTNLSKALALLGRAAKALVTGSLGAVVVVLAAAAALWQMYSNRVQGNARALREYEGATDALLAKLEAQRQAVKTLDQLSAAYKGTLDELAQAYRDEAAAAGAGQSDRRTAAIERQIRLKRELEKMDSLPRDTLEKNAFYVENQTARRGNARAETQAQIDADRQTMSPLAREASLRKEAEKLGNERAAAVKENLEIQTFEQNKQGVGTALMKNQAQQAEQTGRMDMAMSAYKANPSEAAFAQYDAAVRAMDALRTEEQALLQQELQLAEAQDSAIVKMQAKLTLYAKYQAAVQSIGAAETKLRELQNSETEGGEDAEKRAAAIEAAERALVQAQKQRAMLENVAGAAGITPASAQVMSAEVERLKRELQQALVNKPQEIAARAQAEQEKRARERAVAESGQAARMAGTEETRGALAAAEAQLRIEKERLEQQRSYKEIDDEVYRNRLKALKAEERMLALKKALAVAENTADQQSAQKKLEAQAARLGGRGAEARKLEEDAARIEEDAGKARRARELMDQTGLSKAEAEKQADTEVQRNRMGRELEREGGLFQALMGRGQQVDSLQRIGGGGGVSAGADTKKVVERLDKLIQTVKGLNVGGAAQRLN
jgi:hypothetical protein